MAVQIPQILIHPAAEESVAFEPPSPFASIEFESGGEDFRPHYLSPPPTVSTHFVRHRSPLAPTNAPKKGNGIEKSRFEALLRATREKNNVARKAQDLRKEVALKVHKSKQMERRALFLSKVAQPPSPTAADTPITPPQSPSIFHYSLPSPGLVSPIAHYESLQADPKFPLGQERKGWVEQVDFRLPAKKVKSPARSSFSLPSLDEISARLNAHREAAAFASVPTITIDAPEPVREHKTRLPAFLLNSRPTTPVQSDPVSRPRIAIGKVGRLCMPSRQTRTPTPEPVQPPETPAALQLEVTTVIIPHAPACSPVELSQSNLQALDSREKRSADMLSRLRRRSTLTTTQSAELSSKFNATYRSDTTAPRSVKWKRHSAPADMQPRLERSHPVLSMPGGF